MLSIKIVCTASFYYRPHVEGEPVENHPGFSGCVKVSCGLHDERWRRRVEDARTVARAHEIVSWFIGGEDDRGAVLHLRRSECVGWDWSMRKERMVRTYALVTHGQPLRCAATTTLEDVQRWFDAQVAALPQVVEPQCQDAPIGRSARAKLDAFERTEGSA